MRPKRTFRKATTPCRNIPSKYATAICLNEHPWTISEEDKRKPVRVGRDGLLQKANKRLTDI